MAKTVIAGSKQRLPGSDFKRDWNHPPRDYLVVDTKAEADKIREAMGRRMAREQGKVWPIPGTRVGKGPHGDGRSWWKEDYYELANGKFAFINDSDIDRWVAAAVEEDTDGTKPPISVIS
jgi:hypothetical protein